MATRSRLWQTAYGSQETLYPNLTCRDPGWRGLFRDTRFRRALSLGIDRHEINNALYYGLAVEGQNTVLPGSPLYDATLRKDWAQYDPAAAEKLLDEIGLTRRDEDGIRLLPDGRRLQITVEYAGQSGEQSDILELIGDSWRGLGVALFAKPYQVTVLHNRLFAGDTLMTIDRGLENGLATPSMSPAALAPAAAGGLAMAALGPVCRDPRAVGRGSRSGAGADAAAAVGRLDRCRRARPARGDLAPDAAYPVGRGLLDRPSRQRAATGCDRRPVAQCAGSGNLQFRSGSAVRHLQARPFLVG
ncbi:MAG: ABC transporter substrate-binding protein [Aliidongia sp.]